MTISTEQLKSVKALRDGMAHHDDFGAVPDDSPLLIDGPDGVLYELPDENGQFCLGDLRNILAYFREEGYI